MNILIVDNGYSLNNGVMAMAIALRNAVIKKYIQNKILLVSDAISYQDDKRRFADSGINVLLNGLRPRVKYGRIFFFFSSMITIIEIVFKKIVGKNYHYRHPTLNAIQKSDCVVSLRGEDFLSDNCSFDMCLYQVMHVLCANAQKKPFVLLAQTFGPFNKKSRRWMIQLIAKKISLITARDKDSFRLLSSLLKGKDKNKLHWTADMTFLMEPIKEREAKKILRKVNIHTDKKMLGVSVSDLFTRFIFPDIKNFIQKRKTFIKTIAKILDDVIEIHDLNVLFTPHVFLHGNDDRLISHSIRAVMHNKNRAFVLDMKTTAPQIKGIISLCNYFIGCRMHALIAAISSSVPTFALAYSPKTMQVIHKDLDYPHVIDARKINSYDFIQICMNYLRQIISNSSQVNSKLSKTIKKIQKRSEININLLFKQIQPD